MYRWTYTLKAAWFNMLEPPWRHTGPNTGPERAFHWFAWLVGWTWALAGLTLGAVAAPWLVQFAGFQDAPYQDTAVIAAALVAGFAVQFLAWCLLTIAEAGGAAVLPDTIEPPRLIILARLATVVLVALPFLGVSYALYLYFALVGADHRSVTVAFVGGLLVTAFLIPFIKSLVTGVAFKGVMNWLRGGKKKGA